MMPSTEQLSQWILDEILRLKIARHQGFSAHEVVAAVVAKHLAPFYPEGEATRRPVEKELFPLAAKVMQRHFDPESVIEEQAAGLLDALQNEIAAGREPSQELWEALNEAQRRVIERGDKLRQQGQALLQLGEWEAQREPPEGPTQVTPAPPMDPGTTVQFLLQTEDAVLRAEGLTPEEVGEDAFAHLLSTRVQERHLARILRDRALRGHLIEKTLLNVPPERLRGLAAVARNRGHTDLANDLDRLARAREREAGEDAE
jgi:hypothetical protein